jgi:hypothetical protein
MIGAPYHACKAKSQKLLDLIEYSSKFKTMWGYLEEAKEEFETAYNLYQKNNDKRGMSYLDFVRLALSAQEFFAGLQNYFLD